MENWLPITGLRGYEISNLGRVKSLKRGKERIVGFVNSVGYRCISIGSKQFLVHRLSAKTFLPNPKEKKEVNHINGIKTDNRVENLEWCTRKENDNHARENGLTNNTGSNNYQAKINEDDVCVIWSLLKKGLSQQKIADKYNVSRGCIKQIKERKSWRHVTDNLKL